MAAFYRAKLNLPDNLVLKVLLGALLDQRRDFTLLDRPLKSLVGDVTSSLVLLRLTLTATSFRLFLWVCFKWARHYPVSLLPSISRFVGSVSRGLLLVVGDDGGRTLEHGSGAPRRIRVIVIAVLGVLILGRIGPQRNGKYTHCHFAAVFF